MLLDLLFKTGIDCAAIYASLFANHAVFVL